MTVLLLYMCFYFRTSKLASEKSLNYIVEALGECRPPWPKLIITPLLPNVKMLSLGGERLTTKVLDHYRHHDLVMLPLLWSFLLIYSS